MQEWELWLHRSPNSMYNILCLWSWSLVFEQANYCQSNIDNNEEDADDAEEDS